MRLKDTINYIDLWETLNNPKFNRFEFDTFNNEANKEKELFNRNNEKVLKITNNE